MKIKLLALSAGLCALSSPVLAQGFVPLPPGSAAPKTYIVQLADAPLATYGGGVAGLQATRPQAGAKLDVQSTAARGYASMLAQRRASVLSAVGGSVAVTHTYDTAFNGFAARLTGAQASKLRAQPGVASVTESTTLKLATTRTPEFIGVAAPGGVWSQRDRNGLPVKGEGVIIGVIDSGIWPEDASFGDKADAAGKPVAYFGSGTSMYAAPPAKWKGVCQAGAGFTAVMCNNKLIGARWYAEGFTSGATLNSFEYLSPRAATVGGGGHGAHTASTAGGNEGVSASINGVPAGDMSGIAPRARIAAYKACWEAADPQQTGCNSADLVKAIDDAVADGVDVINYSISGTNRNFNDPQEIAFYNAAAAGVFVAAAAGNSGPGNTVAHPSPWLTTVAATTHDRYTVAPVVLGNGSSFSGPSFQRTGLPSTSLILAGNAGVKPLNQLSAEDQTALQNCYSASDRAIWGGSPDAAIDPAKTAGKIVVCQRGGSYLVNKAEAVKALGGAGMVLLNTPTSTNEVYNEPFVVPTVHLDVSAYAPVMAYGNSSNPTARFGPGVQAPNVVAPVMAAFSSRGPNLGDADILKPEIAAPGVDVIAAWTDTSMTQAQHDALASNNLQAKANANSISGTSMATPHIAGVAALFKQLYPNWSPAAIKSAMMTTAGNVLQNDGRVDAARFGYGAGQVNPNAAIDPGLVYDITTADFARFLCGKNITPPAGSGTCAALGSIRSYELNLAAVTASNVLGQQSFKRTVTNVGKATATYTATAELEGWQVTVSPSSLTLAPGASATFSVTLSPSAAAKQANAWAFGKLVWSDGSHRVTSPITAKTVPFAMPRIVLDKRSTGKGTQVFSVGSNYTGGMSATQTGLLPSTATSGNFPDAYGGCVEGVVPANTKLLGVAFFESEFVLKAGGAMPDLAAVIFDPLGNVLAAGNVSTGSNEQAYMVNPPAGTYYLCATDLLGRAGSVERVTLHRWIITSDSATFPLKVATPTNVYDGGSASVSLGWDVPRGQRYLGAITLRNTASQALGNTGILVDNK